MKLDFLIETGHFVSVTFRRADGKVSHVHGRTGVHKHTKGNRKTVSSNKYILIYDLKRGYRNINRDTILTVNGEKLKIARV